MSKNYEVKQVIVMRKDLNMRKGKMVAQGAHASMAVLLNHGYFLAQDQQARDPFIINMTDDMEEWVRGSFAKICVSVDSEEQLLFIHSAAQNAGLPCSLIQDSGHTEFNGVPTHTAVAIGPANSEEVNKITGLLKLL